MPGGQSNLMAAIRKLERGSSGIADAKVTVHLTGPEALAILRQLPNALVQAAQHGVNHVEVTMPNTHPEQNRGQGDKPCTCRRPGCKRAEVNPDCPTHGNGLAACICPRVKGYHTMKKINPGCPVHGEADVVPSSK